VSAGRCRTHPPSPTASASAAPEGGRRHGRRPRRALLAAALALVVVALSPSIARAEEAGASIEANCSSVTINLSGFPNAENNMVTVHIRLKRNLVKTETFTFNGSSATEVVPLEIPLKSGKQKIDVSAEWNTNGAKGHFDHFLFVTCKPPPKEHAKGKIEGSCEGVTVFLSGFPNAIDEVTEIVRVDGVIKVTEVVVFQGPSETNTIPLTIPTGKHKIDVSGLWNTNGVKGHFDHFLNVKCIAT
jgi:hypothetical protein